MRARDWTFNAGRVVDGLYFPWDLDDQVAQKVCEIERVDSYRTEGFVLEGGSIHVDGEGTVLTTEMCLLSEGRNPDMDRGAIERMLCDYLGCEKVLWLRDGIDPEETNGHIDDVACFIRPARSPASGRTTRKTRSISRRAMHTTCSRRRRTPRAAS